MTIIRNLHRQKINNFYYNVILALFVDKFKNQINQPFHHFKRL